MTKRESVSGVPERSVPEATSVCESESSVSTGAVSDSFVAAMFCAFVVPAALWAYDGSVVLAASAATFASIYMFGRALGTVRAVIGGLRRNRKKYRVEYVSRQVFDGDRRLGYVSAEQVCLAAKKGREEK